ncbi:MAG: aminotransferase class IV, partial [Gammaproteobacteria bacterium]|nr:aminotransferase class IV [Gammaproteobacteria bacterium]
IIHLAKENNISCAETTITPAMLKNADEIWVTGSVKEICPIVILDGKTVGDGKVGPMWKLMITLYEEQKHR